MGTKKPNVKSYKNCLGTLKSERDMGGLGWWGGFLRAKRRSSKRVSCLHHPENVRQP